MIKPRSSANLDSIGPYLTEIQPFFCPIELSSLALYNSCMSHFIRLSNRYCGLCLDGCPNWYSSGLCLMDDFFFQCALCLIPTPITRSITLDAFIHE